MAFKINTTVRNAVRQALANSASYDPATMHISRKGMVTAKADPDKTFKGPDSRRYYIGHAEDMVTQDGTIREGY